MAGGSRECRDCGAPIQFIEGRNGKWIPAEPGTEDRHRCQLDQTCEACGKPFKGANWMSVCQSCYKAQGRNDPGPSERPSPPRTKEPLKDDLDDDPPF